MPMERKPDAQDIDEAYTYFYERWQNKWGVWQTIDTYVNGTYPVWPSEVAKVRPTIRPARPASIVDHAADNQMAYDPKVERPIYGYAQANEQKASRIENAVTAILIDSGMMEPVFPPKMLGRYLITYGYAVVEGPMLDLASMPKEPEKTSALSEDEYQALMEQYKVAMIGWNPFRYRAPHPTRVLMDPSKKMPDVTIRLSSRLVKDLEELTAEKSRTRKDAIKWQRISGLSSYDTVGVAEYWSHNWHALKIRGGIGARTGAALSTVAGVGGELLFVERNPWGFNPYAQAFSGFGHEDSESTPYDPEDLAIGVLDRLLGDGEHMGMLSLHAQNMSAKHNLLIEAAFAPRGTSGDTSDAAQAAAEGKWFQGRKEDFWVLEAPNISQGMFQVGSEMEQDIEQGSYASHLAGLREEGVVTVGQQQMLSTQAGKKFVHPAKQVESLMTILCQRILLHMIRMNKTFRVRGTEISPEDIERNPTVNVRFEIVDPVLDLQRRNIGLNEFKSRIINDTEYAKNYAHIEDEFRRQLGLLQMDVRMMPEVQAILKDAVAKGMGLQDAIKAFREAMAQMVANQQGQGQPGSNGAKGAGAGAAEIRQPLTGDTVKPAPARVPPEVPA